MNIEIATIALQLLTQVQKLHQKLGIVLKFLAPQFIVIKERNNFFEYMPKLEIVGVETMLIADRLMGPNKCEKISDINKLFLARECWKETKASNIWESGCKY